MKRFIRKYAVKFTLVALVLALSVVAAFAQTPVPSPTTDELVDSGMTLILGFGLIIAAMGAGVVWRLFLRGGRGLMRMGG